LEIDTTANNPTSPHTVEERAIVDVATPAAPVLAGARRRDFIPSAIVSHTTAARAAGIAQTPTDTRQVVALAIGTASNGATNCPVCIRIRYSEVHSAIRSGNHAFTSGTITTFAAPIPASASTVDMTRKE